MSRDYLCYVVGSHDGDTVTVNVDLGFHLWLLNKPVRLYGLNCPELNTPEGITASNYTKQWLITHKGPYTLTTMSGEFDKYGRLLGTIKASDGAVLNNDLLKDKQAVVLIE